MIIYSLGSVTFSNIVEAGLYIQEEHKWLGIGQTVRYALAGNPIVMENERSGKPLTIIAEENKGWITKANMLALVTLANQMNTTYTLSLKNDLGANETREVRFKRDSSPIDLTPLDYGEEYYIGSIFLMQVS